MPWPVILADVEVHRFALQDALLEARAADEHPGRRCTVLGKSVVGEQHPFYLGVYEGALGRDDVRRYVEGSDCVIMFGAFLTDINLGIYTAQLDPLRAIYANSEKLSIRYHTYENVRFKDFMRGLLRCRLRPRVLGKIPKPPPAGTFRARPGGTKVTVQRLFERLNDFLGPNTMVVADVGDALFGATDLFIRHRTEFLGPAYYASMGFAVPAGLGAQLANPKLRPLVLVGDGAFQMTGLELSTIARYALNPIVIVLNNLGYGTERNIQDGPYNDVLPWHYSRLPEILGVGRGFLVETETQLDPAPLAAKALRKSFCLLDCQIDHARPLARHATAGRTIGAEIGSRRAMNARTIGDAHSCHPHPPAARDKILRNNLFRWLFTRNNYDDTYTVTERGFPSCIKLLFIFLVWPQAKQEDGAARPPCKGERAAARVCSLPSGTRSRVFVGEPEPLVPHVRHSNR